MFSRSDASASAPSGFVPDGDGDLLAINGHHFDLGGPIAPVAGDFA